MTLERARVLLGDQITNITDDEVADMISRDIAFVDSLLDLLTRDTKMRQQWN